MCTFTVNLAGQPGVVTVHAQDTEGPEGSSQLTPDSLEINLSAGAMAGLAFEETQRLHCGLRDCIGALKLLAVDAYGNTASCAPFEVPPLPWNLLKLSLMQPVTRACVVNHLDPHNLN